MENVNTFEYLVSVISTNGDCMGGNYKETSSCIIETRTNEELVARVATREQSYVN